VLVFWKSIEPFLKDAMVRMLDETFETCRVKNYEPEPHLRETAMLLRGHLISPIYSEMADIDRHLRGKGNPKSVPRRDLTDEITYMERVLDGLMKEFLAGAKTEERAAGNAGAATSDKRMTWQEVQGKLLVMCENGERYTTVKALAASIGCGTTTLHKAIIKSARLRGWQKRDATGSPKPKAQSLNAVVTDNEQNSADDPSNVLTDDDVDTEMRRLIEQAETPEKRAKLASLTPEERRDLVRAFHEQNYDQLLEDRTKKGPKLLGRRP
jgi:hypothetical protein